MASTVPIKRMRDDDEDIKPIKRQETSDSDEDDSDDEGSDEIVYDASDEPFPIHGAFDPGLKSITATATKLVEDAQRSLQKHAPKSATLQNMLKNASETLAPPKTEPLTICSVGPTGDGKSSAGNSIVGVKGLMRTGSSGSSITNVATVYMRKFPDQRLNYAAKIRCRSEKETREMLEDLITCYKQSKLGSDDEWTKEQTSEFEMHGQEATKTFSALFCHKVGFRSRDETEKSMEEQVDSDGSLLVERMLAWCKEYYNAMEQIDGIPSAHFDAETVTDLDVLIRQYTTSTPHNGQPSLWPLVHDVRIATSESRFLEYVRLVDLPGQSDTNPIRSRTADEYIRKCQGLWIFADIKRAITDPNLHRAISLYAERFPDTLAVVLTKIDHGIDDGLVEDLRTQGEDMQEYDSANEEVARLTKEEAKADKRLRKPGKDDTDTVPQKLAKWQKAQVDLKESETQRFDAIVKARNHHAVQNLQQDKQKFFSPGRELRVFPVSPMHYEVHTTPAKRKSTFMSVAVTGIPALRDYALMLAGEPLWRVHTKYLEAEVSVFINGLVLWAQGCAAQDRDALLSVLRDMQNDGDAAFEGVAEHRVSVMQKCLFRPLQRNRKQSRDRAYQELEKLLNHWTSVSWISFYRHYGQHTTHKRGAVSWNENFLQAQTHDTLDPGWHAMLPLLDASFSDAKDKILSQVDETKKKLLLSPAAVSLDKTIIQGLFKGVINGIQSDFAKTTGACKQETLAIKLDATKDRHHSFFTVAMRPAYSKGNTDKGHGVSARCKNHMRKHLSLSLDSADEPFGIHNREVTAALKKSSSKFSKQLHLSVNTRISELYKQFESITEQKPETAAEASARKAIKPFLTRAVRDIEHIDAMLEQIRHKYPAC